MSNEEFVCSMCLKPIDKKGNYFLIQSYKLGTFLGRKHYHWSCFQDRLEPSKQLTDETIEKTIELLNKTSRLLVENGNDD